MYLENLSDTTHDFVLLLIIVNKIYIVNKVKSLQTRDHSIL